MVLGIIPNTKFVYSLPVPLKEPIHKIITPVLIRRNTTG